MWKAALAGAFALATIGSSLAFAEGQDDNGMQRSGRMTLASAHVGQMESGLSQFKTALRLTPAQERHWPAVESAIRDFVRHRAAEGEQAAGFVQRVRRRAGDLAMSAVALKRLVVAAGPLIKSLEPGQKHEALSMARGMGFGEVVARFE